MRENFPAALAAVLHHEGGYVHHSRDPGGATNRGVTQMVYDAFRAEAKLPKRSVRFIHQKEVAAIYRDRYWNAVRGDDLPSGVDYAVFDLAVNSGVSRAARFLQREVGATPDGNIGPATLAVVRLADPRKLIAELSASRLAFLQGLGHFDTFGRGWTRRVREVEAAATRLA